MPFKTIDPLPETEVTQPFADIPGWLEHNLQGGIIEARKAGINAQYPHGQWYLAIKTDPDSDVLTFAYSSDYVTCDENGKLSVRLDHEMDTEWDRIA